MQSLRSSWDTLEICMHNKQKWNKRYYTVSVPGKEAGTKTTTQCQFQARRLESNYYTVSVPGKEAGIKTTTQSQFQARRLESKLLHSLSSRQGGWNQNYYTVSVPGKEAGITNEIYGDLLFFENPLLLVCPDVGKLGLAVHRHRVRNET